jgi:N-acylneuraminate cytidylyltransferase
VNRVFAFVFARGGSKGLPRKNVLKLEGKPLLAHSIEAAKEVSRIEKIFVSTEDPEIKRIAKEYGAEVIDRPPELAEDRAAELDAWRHAVSYLKSRGEAFDVLLSLPATSPLRSVEDVTSCLEALDSETDVVLTVTPASRSPYFNMVSREPDGTTHILSPSSGYSRRQDVPEAFDITTVAYAVKTAFLQSSRGLLDGKTKSVVVPKERAVDIDDYWDYKFVELIYQEMNHVAEG